MGWLKEDEPPAKYTLRFKSNQDLAKSKLPWDEKSGPSPGGAAAELAVSRQTVYNWINEGWLHQVYVGPEPPAVYITTHSIKRVKAVLDQLRYEWKTGNLKGCNVASELKKRLPQQDLFVDGKL
jgi:transposase